VAHGDKESQTSPAPTQDQATQVLSRPHQETSSTQTPAPASTSDQGQQVLLRPPRSVAFTQTEKPATSRTTSWTQKYRPSSEDSGTDMPPVNIATVGSQAGCYFNNDTIPPGAPQPKLLWAYTYAQFDELLAAYPELHPEDFVTFGILQEQPRRG